MERKDNPSGGSKNNDRKSIDNTRQENIPAALFGEVAFKRNDNRNIPHTDDALNNSITNEGDADAYKSSIRNDSGAPRQGNLFAAGTRFGEEITGNEKADHGADNHSSLASSKFGEEPASREPGLYADDITRPFATDDLTDDNDILTERKDSYNVHADNKDDHRNLLEKIKDKVEDFEEGIKKAFD